MPIGILCKELYYYIVTERQRPCLAKLRKTLPREWKFQLHVHWAVKIGSATVIGSNRVAALTCDARQYALQREADGKISEMRQHSSQVLPVSQLCKPVLRRVHADPSVLAPRRLFADPSRRKVLNRRSKCKHANDPYISGDCRIFAQAKMSPCKGK